MAPTNRERVAKALDYLRDGLAPFIQREVDAAIKTNSIHMDVVRRYAEDPIYADKTLDQWDAAGLLKLMWETWNSVFRQSLGHTERSMVSEIRDWRNKWAHQENFSSDDSDRALDSMARLLTAVSAPQADEVNTMKRELRRLVFDEQVRSEKRKVGGSLIDAAATNLKAWRDVVMPHPDVSGGRYQQAEFAADLWQVHIGEGSDEYRDPEEFFRRTYLTESLRKLLVNAAQRLTANGGDPIVQLQTNFGGGKTHSMLALYHLFSGIQPNSLAGVEDVLKDTSTLPTANRVVLVGTKLSPGQPDTKADGTVVHTLWGELAYQLGGKAAYEQIRGDDERGTNPGDKLRQLFKTYGPCLILIDEWVAYARQLHEDSDLPAGSFETQFSFAQALTESAKGVNNCLLVVSLPASDGSDSSRVANVEVGGVRGREALDRLRNVIGRMESAWRPATAEEGFEIVRRRLFQEPSNDEAYKQRDVTARAFADYYRANTAEFPPDCHSADYEKRIRAAYPIHPEVFDQLYGTWSTLVKFQRTRGVLRLMAIVIHTLWEKGDRSPLIMPSMIPIDNTRVQHELTRYLPDNWAPIIEKDVDGPNSLPLRTDNQQPALGKLQASRRVSRTIYMGSAPLADATQRGIEDRHIKLGCALPGEPAAVFGDALRRLASTSTHLYQDGSHFWYSTQPTVTKLAEDRAEQLSRDPDKVKSELEQRVQNNLRTRGIFTRVHPFPSSSSDVIDDLDTRLVVLSVEHPHSKESSEGNPSPARQAAEAILESRGNSPRLYRNTLVFLAADKVRLQDLDEALRKVLAWDSILTEKNDLNLDPHQVRQAETQRKAADGAVSARLPETFVWLLVPEQRTPQDAITWEQIRLSASGGDALAERVSKRLKQDELVITTLASTILRKYLDDVPLWRGADKTHVAIKQLVEDFARYLYLPRLSAPSVLIGAIHKGLSLLTWQSESFAYAEGYEEEANHYAGLQIGQHIQVTPESNALLVKPATAEMQFALEEQRRKQKAEPKPATYYD